MFNSVLHQFHPTGTDAGGASALTLSGASALRCARPGTTTVLLSDQEGRKGEVRSEVERVSSD